MQIRNHEMHRVAEQGIAAHWMYKGSGGVRLEDSQRFAWLKQLARVATESPRPAGVLAVREGATSFRDEVYCFTPKGRLSELPRRRDGDRFRLPDPLRGREPLHGRARQRQARAAALPAAATATPSRSSPRRSQTPSKDWLEDRQVPPRQGEHPRLDQVRSSARVAWPRSRDPRARPRPLQARARQASQRRPTGELC